MTAAVWAAYWAALSVPLTAGLWGGFLAAARAETSVALKAVLLVVWSVALRAATLDHVLAVHLVASSAVWTAPYSVDEWAVD